jgi:hypothetical protein
MPRCSDDRLSIRLICECNVEPIGTKSDHEVTLDNQTTQVLYDVAYLVCLAYWSTSSRLEVSRQGSGQPASGSASWRSGSLPAGQDTKEVFELTPLGSSRRGETVDTTADWTLSPNGPLAGIPPKRFSRRCDYTVLVA